jgi:ribosomal 30S subunit maturation factor RimM
VIRVGQVAGAFGLDGAVKVIPLTEFIDRFDVGSCLLLDGSQRQVEWSRESQPGLVVKLRGIDNRTMAELFRGRYLELMIRCAHSRTAASTTIRSWACLPLPSPANVSV